MRVTDEGLRDIELSDHHGLAHEASSEAGQTHSQRMSHARTLQQHSEPKSVHRSDKRNDERPNSSKNH